MSEQVQFTKQQYRGLLEYPDGVWPEGFEFAGDHTLGMNSHGVVEKRMIIRRVSDGKLFGVPYGYSSEEWFFDEGLPAKEVASKEVVKVVYTNPDGSDIREWCQFP